MLLVIGYWLLVIGYWLLVIGYWLLVIFSINSGAAGIDIEDTAVPFPYATLIVGTRHCRVLISGNINSDATLFSITLKLTKPKTRVCLKIGVSILISCNTFKLYVSRRGGKSKASNLLGFSPLSLFLLFITGNLSGSNLKQGLVAAGKSHFGEL